MTIFNISNLFAMTTFLERLKAIADANSLSTRAFAIKIGFNYSTLHNYFNGRRISIDYELADKTLSSFSDISAEWLIRGKGSMLLSDEANKNENEERISRLVDTITTLQGTINELTKANQLLLADNSRLKGELTMIRNERLAK